MPPLTTRSPYQGRTLKQLTQGGPGNATTLLSYQIYQLAFTGLYYGYGSAVAVFAFLMVVALSLIFFFFMRRSERAL